MNKKQVTIVIPIYKTTLSDDEKMSLRQCFRVLSKYPVVLIQPEGLDSSYLTNIYTNLAVETFPAEYFKGIEGYNRLMLSPLFYERFINSPYMLIYQLDAFVFKDDLTEWCNKGYDYVGAPWIATPRSNLFPRITRLLNKLRGKSNKREIIFFKTGNGGFSLRKTESMLRVTREYQAMIEGYLNAQQKEIYSTEDVFFSIKVPELTTDFKIPEYHESVAFAMDRKPNLAMKINHNELPFGCHGFNKKKVKNFWAPYIDATLYQGVFVMAPNTSILSGMPLKYSWLRKLVALVMPLQ